jgi:polynucleotide 5'-triphosphatase
MLNDRVAHTAAPSYTFVPLKAKHIQTQDDFHPAPSSHSSDHHDAKLRVTRNDRTGQLVECMIKRRLGDLHILCPKREADWRISVNIQEKVDISVLTSNSKALYTRKKDRMEYAHQWFRIDLTQVTDGSGSKVCPFS